MELRVLDLINDKTESLRLMKAVYGNNSEVGRSEFYDWQYIDNPAGQALVVGFFTKENQLVSQVASIPTSIIVNGTNRIHHMTLNIATEDAYRGRHLVSSLFAHIHKQFGGQFTFGMPNANSFNLHKRIGYEVIKIPILFKLIRPSKVNKNIPSFIDRMIYRIDKGAVESTQLLTTLFTEEHCVAEPSLEVFPIFRERNAKYLNWRFNSSSIREYVRFIHRRDRTSYLIGRAISIDKRKISIICEIKASNKEIAKDLIHSFCAYSLESEDISIVLSGFLKNNPPYYYLKLAGFHELPDKLRPHPLALCIKQLSPTRLVDFYNPCNWFFSLGDFDVF
ncbi:GNAT family N-acetyltransferase [Nitrososphaera viennensis]|uniref:GNAT family N-acetyltransferase n=1 Tax=Nitrososphaera viennensis TaxID=1034015 RepID=A0A977ICB3_9ARCH|nr:GNAT family N-acetyltransferase [Nitrososphaera viennensis]UVS68369.1 GNAT family N-acetyltransferase [Nitrososphaera viennensis]